MSYNNSWEEGAQIVMDSASNNVLQGLASKCQFGPSFSWLKHEMNQESKLQRRRIHIIHIV